MSAIYITCVTIWAWIEFHDISDPEYSNASDIPSFSVCFFSTLSYLAFIYIILLLLTNYFGIEDILLYIYCSCCVVFISIGVHCCPLRNRD